MVKKIMMLAISVGALVAFAAPAVAQATELTDPPGTKLPVGSKITATSTNLETTTAGGTLFCEKVTIHGKVAVNGPNNVTINQTTTTTQNCEVTGGSAVTITNPAVGTITLSNEQGSAAASFVADIGAECTFSGTVGLTYESETDILNVPGSLLSGSPSPPCPSSGEIHGSFTLETENGTAVIID